MDMSTDIHGFVFRYLWRYLGRSIVIFIKILISADIGKICTDSSTDICGYLFRYLYISEKHMRYSCKTEPWDIWRYLEYLWYPQISRDISGVHTISDENALYFRTLGSGPWPWPARDTITSTTSSTQCRLCSDPAWLRDSGSSMIEAVLSECQTRDLRRALAWASSAAQRVAWW